MQESRIEELKRLIQESNERIKRHKQRIKEIDSEMSLVNQKIAEEKINQFKKNPPKILTKFQMELLQREREKDLKEKREQEIKNIESSTKEAFETAKEIRNRAKFLSSEEINNAECEALKIEIKALEKELNIRELIYEEASENSEDALAQKISDEFRFIQAKKKWDTQRCKSLNDSDLTAKLRQEFVSCQSVKNRSTERYIKCANNLREAESKLFKTRKKLNNYIKTN